MDPSIIPPSFTLHANLQSPSTNKLDNLKGHLQCNSLLTNKNQWIAVKILNDSKQAKQSSLTQPVKDWWSGIKWKPVTLLDGQGKAVKALVDVDSAIKSLSLLGFSKEEVQETIKKDTLLGDVLTKTLTNRIDSLYSKELKESDRKQFVTHFSNWIAKGEMSEADVDKLLKEAHRSHVSTIEDLKLLKDKFLFNKVANHSSLFKQYTTEYSGIGKEKIFEIVKQIAQEKKCTYEAAMQEFVKGEKASVEHLSSEIKLIKKIGEKHQSSLSDAVKRFTSQRQQLMDKLTPFCQILVEKEPLANTLMEWLLKGEIGEADITELLKGSQISGIEELSALKEKQLFKKEAQKLDQFKEYLHSCPWMAQSEELWENLKKIKQSKNCSYGEAIKEFLKAEKNNTSYYTQPIAQMMGCSLQEATRVFDEKTQQLSEKIEPFCLDSSDKDSFARTLLTWVVLKEITEDEIDTLLKGKKISSYQELNDSKNFFLSIRGIQKPDEKAQTIQNAFKHFSFKKKINAEVTRMGTARKRQTSQVNEKPLYEMEVNSQEKLKNAQTGLREWQAVTDSSLNKTPAEKRKLIEQNQKINTILSIALEEIAQDETIMQQVKFKVVCDEFKNMQGAALFKTGEKRDGKAIPLYISYISTAPWNLRNVEATQNDTRKVEGAATALIESAVYESIKTGSQGAVALEAVPIAVDFYKKLGFKAVGWAPSEKGLISMEFSIADAQRFLASDKVGRALPIEEAAHIAQIQKNKTDVSKQQTSLFKKISLISGKVFKKKGN